MKPHVYGDMEAFAQELRDMGYADVRLIDTAQEMCIRDRTGCLDHEIRYLGTDDDLGHYLLRSRKWKLVGVFPCDLAHSPCDVLDEFDEYGIGPGVQPTAAGVRCRK